MSGTVVLQLALGGPVVAAIAWLALVRLPVVRRPVAGVLALGANAAAWTLFWFIYRGDTIVWRSFEPELLGATILAIAEIPLMLAALRADSLPDGGSAPVIGGLAVSATAIAAIAYGGSLAVDALVLVLPTIAAAAASLSGSSRPSARGLIGLAAADAIALVGLSLVYARTGSVVVEIAGGLGPALLLTAALIKGGAIPGLATWRLSATDEPGAWLDVAMRGQAVALAAIAALEMRAAAPAGALAIAAALTVVACAGGSVLSKSPGSSVAAVSGAGFSVCLFALGLGGVVGSRAFLLLFPAFLIAAGLVAFLGRPLPGEAREKAEASGPWGWLAAGAIGVGLASLLGLPPGGGFPGTWLALSLAASRSEGALGWLLAAGAVGAGLAVAMIASIPLLRSVRARAWQAAASVALALTLLYVGTQPIRIAIGWWVRVETELGLPEVLPTAGPPGLPAIGGMNLLLMLAPGLLLVAAVIGVGRGVRDVAPAFVPSASELKQPELVRRVNKTLTPVSKSLRPLKEYAARARALGAGFGIAAALELAAFLMVGRIVLLAARAGFL